MSAFKRINVSDSFVVPYTANKSWDILSESFDDTQVTFNIGIKDTSSVFDPINEFKTNDQYDRLVYDMVNATYYPDFLPTSSDTASRQGTIFNDGTLSTSSYYNGFVDLGNLDTIKFYPTGQGDIILTVNIPRQLTSEKILPTTFELNCSANIDCNNYAIGPGLLATTFQFVSCSGQISTLTLTPAMPIFNVCVLGSAIRILSGDGGFSSLGTTCSASPVNVSGKIYDDGNYNLFYSGNTIMGSAGYILSSSMYVGNVFYEQDIAILTVMPHNILPTFSPSPSLSPSISPSLTPSITPTITPTISVTPTVTSSPNVTPSNTPSISLTVTPTISITPTITPSTSGEPVPTLSVPVTPSPTTSPAAGCLVYDTIITMADGTFKPIQDVVAGDEVLSINSIGEFKLSKAIVLSTAIIFKHNVYNINNGLIKSSEDHRHIVKHNDVWEVKAANELIIGDILLDKDNNEITITSIVIENTPQSVYNLSVDGSNTYFANGILTHNKFQLCCTYDDGLSCFPYTSQYGNCNEALPGSRNCTTGDIGYSSCYGSF